MEKYRQVIKIRIILLSVLALAALAFELIDVFVMQQKFGENMIFCFQCGLAAAIVILSVIQIIRYGAALRDDLKLALLQNSETDERMKAIRAKAGQPFVLIVSLITLIASIIIGYFYPVAFYTLVAVVAFQNIVSGIIKITYMKKM